MVVVLDTNVLLSAIVWGGRLSEILPLCRQKYLTPAFSQATFAETSEKMDRFGVLWPQSKRKLQRYRILLEKLGKFFSIRKPVKICRDPDDDRLLETAIFSKAEFLITGDKDLLVLKKIRNTKIVSPVKFLEEVKLSHAN